MAHLAVITALKTIPLAAIPALTLPVAAVATIVPMPQNVAMWIGFTVAIHRDRIRRRDRNGNPPDSVSLKGSIGLAFLVTFIINYAVLTAIGLAAKVTVGSN
jgi:hypothetical protein